MSTKTLEVTQEQVSAAVDAAFYAGSKDLVDPDLRRKLAELFSAGLEPVEYLSLLREKVASALVTEGKKADVEGVDKRFNTNIYQRQVWLGYIISLGVDAVIAAGWSNVDWADLKRASAMDYDEMIDYVSSKSETNRLAAESKRKANKAAKVAFDTTYPAFNTTLNALLGMESVDDATKDALKKIIQKASKVIG
jgi:hypothetical protein